MYLGISSDMSSDMCILYTSPLKEKADQSERCLEQALIGHDLAHSKHSRCKRPDVQHSINFFSRSGGARSREAGQVEKERSDTKSRDPHLVRKNT